MSVTWSPFHGGKARYNVPVAEYDRGHVVHAEELWVVEINANQCLLMKDSDSSMQQGGHGQLGGTRGEKEVPC